jgi:peroxiredoxin
MLLTPNIEKSEVPAERNKYKVFGNAYSAPSFDPGIKDESPTEESKASKIEKALAKPEGANLRSLIQDVLVANVPSLQARSTELQSSLQRNLATIDEAVSVISMNMRNAEEAHIRQKAAEKILELHGFNNKNTQGDFTINIVTDKNQVNLANVLNPKREE